MCINTYTYICKSFYLKAIYYSQHIKLTFSLILLAILVCFCRYCSAIQEEPRYWMQKDMSPNQNPIPSITRPNCDGIVNHFRLYFFHLIEGIMVYMTMKVCSVWESRTAEDNLVLLKEL